jgi:hypothetical protein
MDPLTTLALLIFVATVFVSGMLPETPVGQAAGSFVNFLAITPLLWRLDKRPDRAMWTRRFLAAAFIGSLLMIPLTMWGKTWPPRTSEVSTFVFFSGAGIVALTVLVWQHFFRPPHPSQLRAGRPPFSE